MRDKSFAVIGLGQFGITLAETLAESNSDVLAVDVNDEKIQEVADKVTYAVRADVREPGVLKSLGVQNVDVVVVAISDDIEASIVATMQAKELGVPFVMAKATNALHGRILDKIGADNVIYPEQSMGFRIAKNLMTNGYVDVFELSSEFSIAEFKIPDDWVGKSLMELKIREKYRINVIGIKQNEQVDVNIGPEEVLQEGCSIIAIGKNQDLNADPAFMR